MWRCHQSIQVFSRLGIQRAQPIDELGRAASARRVEWRQPIVPNPVDVGASAQKILRTLALPAMARTPEGVSEFVGRGRISCEMLLDSIQQTQRRGLPEC